MVYVAYSATTKAQVLSLLAASLPPPWIAEVTAINERSQQRWFEKALSLGFNPSACPIQIQDVWVADAPRSGRPRQRDDHADDVLAVVRKDRARRKLTCEEIAVRVRGISRMSV